MNSKFSATRQSIWLALFLLIASFCTTPTQAVQALSVSIKAKTDDQGIATIDIDEPIRVVLKNVSTRPVKIWNPRTKPGYYCLSFESKNKSTGKSITTRKRRIVDPAFFEAVEDEIEPAPKTITIKPNDTFTIQVNLLGYAWGKFEWLGIPGPNTESQYSVQAKYSTANVKSAEKLGIWNDSIESKPMTVNLVCERIDTPHEYLWNNLVESALEQMKKDPHWIKRTDSDQRTPLHIATRFNHLAVVKWLLENGADVDAQAYNGFTPLHLAESKEAIALILKHKPDLELRCSRGETPLQLALRSSKESVKPVNRKLWKEVAELYLKAGAKYDIISAVYRNDLARVKEIMGSKKPDTTRRNFRRKSPLRRAASLGHVEICRYLLEECKADPDQFEQGSGYPIIKDAVKHPEIVRLLIKHGADLKKRITWTGGRTGFWIIGDRATALHFAAEEGVPKTIQILIDAGIDIFATTSDALRGEKIDQTALDVAAIFAQPENMKTIVEHERFKKSKKETRKKVLNRCLLRTAHLWGIFSKDDSNRHRTLETLLANGADPNFKSNEGINTIQMIAHPTHESETQQRRKTIAMLVDKGGKIDLFSAVAMDNKPVVKNLLAKKSTVVDALGHDGYPALHCAVRRNDLEMVKLLLEAGASVDFKNKSSSTGTTGETALHCAAFQGRPEIANFLIAKGADVSARTRKKNTPLHDAARMANIKIVKLLLEKGAKVDVKDKNGKTPLDYCRELNRPNADAVIKILKAHLRK